MILQKKMNIEHQHTRIGKDGQLYVALQTLKNTHIKNGIIHDKLYKIGQLEPSEKRLD